MGFRVASSYLNPSGCWVQDTALGLELRRIEISAAREAEGLLRVLEGLGVSVLGCQVELGCAGGSCIGFRARAWDFGLGIRV